MIDQPQNLTPLTRALRQAALVAPSDLGREYLEQADTLDNLIRRTKERGDQHLAERLTAALMGAELALDQQMHALAEQIAGAADVGRDTHVLVQGIHLDQQQFMEDTSQRFAALGATFQEIGESIDDLRTGQQELRQAHDDLNQRHGRQLDELRKSIDDLRHGGTELSQQHATAIEQLAAQVRALANDLAQRPGLDETRRLVGLIERHEQQLGGGET